ncbi:MAG: hypothetical protein L0H79_03200 [Intrasporangium sp.]|uniref:hypothetical protein n=1 Tax=Intrasporangium sp. TaxID=1925024 RepID=UPI002649D516|nr:hypothetical protein [Intrasporangium sp.]MDN5794742.1 hypothetical protein [Intrasporangium sp.]
MGELVSAWSDSPILGHGLGAVLRSGFTRSDDRPWMFELQYHQLLFSTGLVGILLTAAALVVLAVAMRRAAALFPEHRSVIVTTGVASTALLLANASNPYLQAVGHQWGAAIGAAVIGALLKSKSRHSVEEPERSSQFRSRSTSRRVVGG